MNGRLIDNGLRLIGLTMIGAIICFLLTPIIVTAIMAFDSRAYLGPLPPPSLSFRWFDQFFSDDYFLRGLKVSLQLAALAVTVSVTLGIATAFAGKALQRTPCSGRGYNLLGIPGNAL